MDLLLERRLPGDGQVGLEELKGLLADPLDQHQVLDLLERAVLLAVVDDAVGDAGTDARQEGELRGVGAVDVDHLLGLRAGGGEGGEDGYQDQQEGDGGLSAFHGSLLAFV